MKNLFFGLAMVWVSTLSAAHEIKELKVTKIWQSEVWEHEIRWMIANTVVTGATKFISCAGFDADGVPLFQTMLLTEPFATEGDYRNNGGYNNGDIVEVRCAYT